MIMIITMERKNYVDIVKYLKLIIEKNYYFHQEIYFHLILNIVIKNTKSLNKFNK